MKKMGIFIFTILLSISFLQANSSTRPISFDDFISIKRVSDPQVSPNGDLIAFVVTEMDKEKNTGNSDICGCSSIRRDNEEVASLLILP